MSLRRPILARETDASRACSALAHHTVSHLRVEAVREQRERQSHRVDVAPFALAVWSSFLVLTTVPHLEIEGGFPVTLVWLRSLLEQTIQLIGSTCLAEPLSARLNLTTDDMSRAAEDRSRVYVELNKLSTWLETRMCRITPSLRLVVERYLNSISELFHEAAEFLPDRVLQHMADRAAEACVRCRFRRAPDSEATPSSVPVIETRPTTTPVQNAVAYGSVPPPGGHSTDGQNTGPYGSVPLNRGHISDGEESALSYEVDD